MTALIDEALAFGRGLLIVRDDPSSGTGSAAR